jgi:hypothetical protein
MIKLDLHRMMKRGPPSLRPPLALDQKRHGEQVVVGRRDRLPVAAEPGRDPQRLDNGQDLGLAEVAVQHGAGQGQGLLGGQRRLVAAGHGRHDASPMDSANKQALQGVRGYPRANEQHAGLTESHNLADLCELAVEQAGFAVVPCWVAADRVKRRGDAGWRPPQSVGFSVLLGPYAERGRPEKTLQLPSVN